MKFLCIFQENYHQHLGILEMFQDCKGAPRQPKETKKTQRTIFAKEQTEVLIGTRKPPGKFSRHFRSPISGSVLSLTAAQQISYPQPSLYPIQVNSLNICSAIRISTSATLLSVTRKANQYSRKSISQHIALRAL